MSLLRCFYFPSWAILHLQQVTLSGLRKMTKNMDGTNKRRPHTMNNRLFLFCLLAVFATSCVNELRDDNQDVHDAPVFYATIEQAGGPSTKVFADDSLRVLWNADDRVSIFNKSTYNRQYRFDGQDGANSGVFKKVPSDDFVASNPLNYVYSVYPYNENTSISNGGEITVYLPAEQSYREDSFGLGANTMIAITEDDELMFKNLCGFFAVRLYGDNVTVSSITLKGNNNEYLAGKATVFAQVDSAPVIQFDSSEATNEITLTCVPPVSVGSTEETAVSFWFVIPPTLFEDGISISVMDDQNLTFSKGTTASLEVKRNTLKKTSVLEVNMMRPNDPIKFVDANLKAKLVAAFDSNADSELSYAEAAAISSLSDVFGADTSYTSFDEFQYFTNVSSVPQGMFENWDSLVSISLPKNIISIGDNAFSGCTSLKSVNLPNTIETIGNYAFNECSSLISIVLPDNLLSLGRYAFNNCSAVEGVISIPEGISVLKEYTFYNCSSIAGFVFMGSSVGRICESCFSMCKGLTSLTLPTGIWSLGDKCFNGCSCLESVAIPNTLYELGPWAFANCAELSNISLPSGISKISKYAFANCLSLQAVTIPETVSRIEEGAFCGCISLSSVIIPNSVSYIGGSSKEAEWWGRDGLGAFEDCSSLTDIVIPDSVSEINISVFRGCTSLASVVIPDSVTKISTSAFRKCTSLKQILIPSSVTTVEAFAFAECSGLELIFIPHTISSLGPCVFYRCSGLRTAVVDEGITTLPGGTFEYCTSLTSVFLPESLTYIAENYNPAYGYYGCFESCTSLADITIPKNVTQIGREAFLNCTGLTSITIHAETPPAGDQKMFTNTNNCPIYVPVNSIDEYKAADYYWSGYSSRLQAIPSATEPVLEAIDMGLSVKWASFNLGASAPEGYGDYYSWGGVIPHYCAGYAQAIPCNAWQIYGYYGYSYEWYNTAEKIIKYCPSDQDSFWGGAGSPDNKIELKDCDYEDDAARNILGGHWRIPSDDEWTDLRTQCTWISITKEGVNGELVIAHNGNSIFIPASGARTRCDLWSLNYDGYYWSSSLNTDNAMAAWMVHFRSGNVYRGDANRSCGYAIRPVCPED